MRTNISAAPLDLSTLRKLWKPRRDSYANAHLYEDNRIRIHRAFTWLERAERCRDQELDDRVLAQWAGLSALFARWDSERAQPLTQRAALNAFVKQIFATDQDGIIAATLERERLLVSNMFTDRYLAKHVESVDLKGLIARRRWDRVLAHLLERCALVHAQLAQGGSTYGSRENRTVLKRTSMTLDALALAVIQVVINHGYSDDWGDLCWRPANR